MGSSRSGSTLSTLVDEFGNLGIVGAKVTGEMSNRIGSGIAGGISAPAIDGNPQCVGTGCSDPWGDRPGCGNLTHHGLPRFLQNWLVCSVSRTIQGSSFGSVADAYLGASKVSIAIIATFKLVASDIRESIGEPSNLGFELDCDLDVNVKRPTSGRYRPDSIPA